MLEILFRGKQIDNDEWVEGYYVCLYDTKGHKTHRIYTGYAETDCGDYYPEWFEVDPETVGRFTGLTDKNRERIFEGDVMEFKAYGILYRGVVTIKSGNAGVFCEGGSPFLDDAIKRYNAVKIGNIHDNPELLEK